MRRAFLVALVAAPTFALAQSTPADGGITFSENTLNAAQCRVTRSSDPPVGETRTVVLSWDIKRPDEVEFSGGGTYRLWAANRDVQAEHWSTGTTTACNVAQTAGDGFVVARVALGSTTLPTNSETVTLTVNTNAIAAAAGYAPDCSQTAEQTIHLCVDWTPANGSPSGWATGTMQFVPTAPTSPPTNPRVAAGDGSLRVTGCTAGTEDTEAFIARATIGDDTATARYSAVSSSCGDLRIGGLVNGTTYNVVVFGLNEVRNPSAPSTPAVQGIPVPTDDFWEHYDGAEQGGCSTAAGAAGILSALSLIAAAAAARRRKP